MKCLFSIICLLVGLNVFSKPSDDIFLFHERDGLPNVSRLINSNQEVNIAYLGGSITAQNGWRVMNFDYLGKKYPQVTFRQINATMGGTGSLLGNLRLEKDVLRHHPNLVFVEFAVNDAGFQDSIVVRSMEGIVQKIWQQAADCDICFVYTTKSDIIEEVGTEKLHHTVIAMEKVAEHYGIPSVYLPYYAIQLLKKGKLKMKCGTDMKVVSGNKLNVSSDSSENKKEIICFSKDGVHPFLNTGHVLYDKTLTEAMERLIDRNSRIRFHQMNPLLDRNCYRNSPQILLSAMTKGGEWKKVESQFPSFPSYKSRFDELWMGEKGATLEFSFKGHSLISYDLISPEGCRLEVTVDGITHYVDRFDKYSTYFRFHSMTLVSGLNPTVTHNVKVKIVDKGLDKRKILSDLDAQDIEKNPQKYTPVRWYVNSIFILE